MLALETVGELSSSVEDVDRRRRGDHDDDGSMVVREDEDSPRSRSRRDINV